MRVRVHSDYAREFAVWEADELNGVTSKVT